MSQPVVPSRTATESSSINYTLHVLDRLEATAGRDALVAGTRRITGTQARATVLRYAAALREAGLRQGDGVALFVKNSPEALLLMLAVHFVGCRLVFVPPEPGNGELEAFVRRAEVEAFVFDPEFEERTRQIIGGSPVTSVFSLGGSGIAADFLAVSETASPLVPEDAADARHLATLMYTGGTTGLPKLVTHRSRYYDLLVAAAGTFVDDVSADPTLLICTLITHTSGHTSSLVGLLTGHKTVLMRTFDAGAALSLIAAEQVTGVLTVTPMLYDLLDHPDCPPDGFPGLRTLMYTGAAAAPARLRQTIERFGPVAYQVYGATEDGIVTQLTPEEHDLTRPCSLTSCGRPGPGTEVELRDEDGKSVPVGETGELYVRSPSVMDGYWNDPERTAEVLDADGWFRTGDLARQDEDGYLYLSDRVRDIIVTGNTADNVYSRLLDDFLIALPEIRNAAAVGVTDEESREHVHVVLVPQDPDRLPDLDALTRRITDGLGELYAPASYSFADALPQTTVGKTDKKALRNAVRGGARATGK